MSRPGRSPGSGIARLAHSVLVFSVAAGQGHGEEHGRGEDCGPAESDVARARRERVRGRGSRDLPTHERAFLIGRAPTGPNTIRTGPLGGVGHSAVRPVRLGPLDPGGWSGQSGSTSTPPPARRCTRRPGRPSQPPSTAAWADPRRIHHPGARRGSSSTTPGPPPPRRWGYAPRRSTSRRRAPRRSTVASSGFTGAPSAGDGRSSTPLSSTRPCCTRRPGRARRPARVCRSTRRLGCASTTSTSPTPPSWPVSRRTTRSPPSSRWPRSPSGPVTSRSSSTPARPPGGCRCRRGGRRSPPRRTSGAVRPASACSSYAVGRGGATPSRRTIGSGVHE